MALTLDIDPTPPFSAILDALSGKIGDANLSFAKYLASQSLPAVKVFDQTVEADRAHAYDPPLSLCPAVTLLTSGFPPVQDRGVGSEIWHFEVAVLFKMELPQKDSRIGLDAFWELVRTVMAGNKTPQIDPLGQISGMADYDIRDEISPPTSSERDGFRVARGMFVVRFRIAERVLS
jgi:hypothetical protein